MSNLPKAVEEAMSKWQPDPALYFRTGREIVDEIREVIRMMEPIVSNGTDDCLCIEAPWHEEDYDDSDPEQDSANPANHSQYCPFYIKAYLQALADGKELPQ